MTRLQIVLATLLAAQALVLAFTWGSGPSGSASSSPLFPELEGESAVRLEIVDPGSGDESETLVLEQGDAGWSLPAVGGFPVDEERIDGVLDQLGQLTVRVPVVRQPRHHESFEVAEGKHQRKLRLWVGDPSGDPDAELLVGSSPNYRRTNVRRSGADEVYEIKGLPSYDLRTDAGAWIDKAFVDVSYDEIESATIDNAQGRLELLPGGEGWTVAGAGDGAFDGDKLESLVRSISSLWFDQPVGPVDPSAHGFDDPQATVILRYRPKSRSAAKAESEAEGETEPDEGGEGEPGAASGAPVETVRLIVGKPVPDEAGKYYATREGFGYTVTLSRVDAERLVDQGRDALRPDPEEDSE